MNDCKGSNNKTWQGVIYIIKITLLLKLSPAKNPSKVPVHHDSMCCMYLNYGYNKVIYHLKI